MKKKKKKKKKKSSFFSVFFYLIARKHSHFFFFSLSFIYFFLQNLSFSHLIFLLLLPFLIFIHFFSLTWFFFYNLFILFFLANWFFFSFLSFFFFFVRCCFHSALVLPFLFDEKSCLIICIRNNSCDLGISSCLFVHKILIHPHSKPIFRSFLLPHSYFILIITATFLSNLKLINLNHSNSCK